MSEANLEQQYIPRLLEKYKREIIPHLREKFNYKNIYQVPKLKKIVINMGVGEATSDTKLVEKAAQDLTVISGQKAKITRARKPISNFKIRKGMAIGCCVTLRHYRMYEFLDRLITVAVPRIRDFRGFPVNSFDGQGNYTFGLTEQTIFPEIDLDKLDKTRGMDITIVTSAETDEEAKVLLIALGFPFRR